MRGEIIYPPSSHSLSTVRRPVCLSVYTCRSLWAPSLQPAVTVHYSTVHYGGITVQYSAVQCSTGAVQVIPGDPGPGDPGDFT